MANLVKSRGEIVLTCPYFLNLRSFVWMSLMLLLDVPMSLTDCHFISPFDIEDWLEGSGMRLVRVQFFDYERANGHDILVDISASKMHCATLACRMTRWTLRWHGWKKWSRTKPVLRLDALAAPMPFT